MSLLTLIEYYGLSYSLEDTLSNQMLAFLLALVFQLPVLITYMKKKFFFTCEGFSKISTLREARNKTVDPLTVVR